MGLDSRSQLLHNGAMNVVITQIIHLATAVKEGQIEKESQGKWCKLSTTKN